MGATPATTTNSPTSKMSNFSKSKSQKQPRSGANSNPSTFTKRKVARSGANSPDNHFLELKNDLKHQNKQDRKKLKTFFFSENINKTTNEKLKLSVDKISSKRISKSSHNHCSCHLTGEDELVGPWYQNKNMEHSVVIILKGM